MRYMSASPLFSTRAAGDLFLHNVHLHRRITSQNSHIRANKHEMVYLIPSICPVSTHFQLAGKTSALSLDLFFEPSCRMPSRFPDRYGYRARNRAGEYEPAYREETS